MNPAETPSSISTFDCDSLQFDHDAGGWRETDESLHELTDPIRGLDGLIGGPVAAIPAVCPTCAYFQDGRCHWCEPGIDYPECFGCDGRTKVPLPWYKRSEITVPLFTTIAVTVVATVGSTIILRRMGLKS